MNNTKSIPYTEDYWRNEGGDKWVEIIDATEKSIGVFDEFLYRHAGIREGEMVLDVGCGGGANSTRIAALVGKSGHVTGLDISPRILAIARERGRAFHNLEFVAADAAGYRPDGPGFDLVFSRFGLMFFSDPVAAMRNLHTLLLPSGRIVYLCWRTFAENPWMKAPAEAVFTVIPPAGPPPDPDAPGPFSLGTREKIELLMARAGFTGLTVDAVDVPINMGPLQQALENYTRLGPAAALIGEARGVKKEQAMAALKSLLEKHETPQGVELPAACWVVTAKR